MDSTGATSRLSLEAAREGVRRATLVHLIGVQRPGDQVVAVAREVETAVEQAGVVVDDAVESAAASAMVQVGATRTAIDDLRVRGATATIDDLRVCQATMVAETGELLLLWRTSLRMLSCF